MIKLYAPDAPDDDNGDSHDKCYDSYFSSPEISDDLLSTTDSRDYDSQDDIQDFNFIDTDDIPF